MWFVVYIFLISQLSEAAVKLPPNVTIPAVIAFGDSIVDQGMNNNINTLVKCNFPPYGLDFMGGTPTGRFSNAKTPPDLVAEELGIKDLVPAYVHPNLQSTDLLTGVSFASGASGYDPQTSQITSVLSLPDQLEMFKEYISKLKALVGEERTDYIIANSIYFVVAGSDDLANTYFIIGARRLHYDVPSYADLVVNYASTFIQDLYDLGARRIAVFGAPPIGCLPSQRTLAGGFNRDCVETYNQAAQVYNSKLSSMLDTFASTPQSRIVYVDIYSPLLDLIQNPRNYGLDVVDRGCCGTGELEVSVLCNKFSSTCPDRTKFLFWDSYHPTETGYKLLVDKILGKYLSRFF
ncbi:GDSL esterase/lipase EXL3 [Heracleum sosnowskyi]|uniref:GDSL esterase/lipase EXL3 n=1 Tax=Heracleum sosnowskyi TaxID=360622 RepID=A0AAD8IWH1_9APIA|nr:GDSL esterase/lipase EXL3 [Heracleum sosnowskyi]